MDNTNQFHRLRAYCKAASTTEFLARGKSVVRCEMCQLAEFACICNWIPRVSCHCEFIVIMHRFEVFKPTNTGRLIADVFPDNTHFFAWSRTEPAMELLALLSDKDRHCFIVFPADSSEIITDQASKLIKPQRGVYSAIPESSKTPTFILLDGTWKQSGRMFHLSRWLDAVACISFPGFVLQDYVKGYVVRKSHQDNYLSTAEAAALCLRMANEIESSEVLLDYFQLFNQHYMATRGCYPPLIGELHHKLSALTLLTT
jgi:DTW domain-containing protein